MNKSNDPSPINGYLIAIVLLLATFVVPRYYLPKWRDATLSQLGACKRAIQQYEEVSAVHKEETRKFEETWSAAAANFENLQFLPAPQLYDRLIGSARIPRRLSPLLISVNRVPVSANNDMAVATARFMYPGVNFEQYQMTLQGPLSDVVDYLKREIEKFPFTLYSSVVVSSGSSGDWPRYQLVVVLPVSG